MKVLHLLASNKYSGAENVVCQIIDMFKGETEMVYCSINGQIESTLNDKGIKFYGLNSLSKKEIRKVVSEFRPDIIHAHDVKASIVASKFHKQCKIISHIHGNDERKMGKLTLKSFLYNIVSKKLEKIIWVSNSCLDQYYFKGKVKDKSVILHNIIDIEKLYSKVEEDNKDYDFDICYLGRLAEIKNPLRALEIMRLSIQRNSSIKCAIVGDGILSAECKNYINENNLQGNIKMFGFVKNPYKILKNSKVLLMSSINEGTPMAIIEAFSLGVPLVSTKVDGAVELIDNNLMGYLYDTNQEAVDAIFNILGSNKKDICNYLKDFSRVYNDIDKYKVSIRQIYCEENNNEK